VGVDKRSKGMLRKKQTNAGFTVLEVVVVVGAIIIIGLVIMFISTDR